MTVIHTERLQIQTLTLEQLREYAASPAMLAESLGLVADELVVEADFPDFRQEIEQALLYFCIPKVAEQPAELDFYTHWVIILPAERRLVGGIGMGGPPTAEGEVMIGYYIDDRYAGRGFAGEATAGFVDWLWQQAGVTSIIADTPAEHLASQRVLLRNGFQRAGLSEEGHYRWRLVKP